MKIGFLGGSFDPVHFGHLLAAQDAYEQRRLDRVVFVPAAIAPLKPAEPRCAANHRMAMLCAAIDGDERFGISELEIQRGGVSYTIDSIRHFRSQHPLDELFWIVGGDQFQSLPLWKDVAELVTLVEFIVLERPGYAAEMRVPIAGLRASHCRGHVFEVSSTELRDRARRGLSLDYFVPQKAIAYIRQHGLYRDAT